MYLLYPASAKADGFSDVFSYHTSRHQVARRVKYRKRPDDDVRHYRNPDDDELCKAPIRGLGTQFIGEQGALDAARKDWMEHTRYDLGEKYIDLSRARDFKKRCGRTSIGETLGQVLYRCEIFARPCRGELEVEEGQR